ncbi:MAG: cyclase family protein [Gemmatimonadaceae bacterium]
MTWIDISVPLRTGSPVWPGDTPYAASWTWSQDAGSAVNVSAITLSPHAGTHADAPFHVRRDAPRSDMLAADAFIGRCTVVDVGARTGELDLSALGHAPSSPPFMRLLLKTRRSVADGTFPDDWPWLGAAAVRALCERGLRLLGVDAPSIDGRESTTLATHNALFEGGAYNLENLDLRHVSAGEYELFAVPLAIIGLDAAPARALLRKLE